MLSLVQILNKPWAEHDVQEKSIIFLKKVYFSCLHNSKAKQFNKTLKFGLRVLDLMEHINSKDNNL